MKAFTTIKIGYTAGVYGCSGEYFTTIVIDGEEHHSFTFSGMYGAEERIARTLKDLGFKEFYTNSIYGRMTRNDIPKKCIFSEHTAIEHIKNGFNWD